MTREKAIKMLEYIRYTGNGEREYKNCAQGVAIDMAIKALEQEPILDRIRLEIEIEKNAGCHTQYAGGLDFALSIIDKYMSMLGMR